MPLRSWVSGHKVLENPPWWERTVTQILIIGISLTGLFLQVLHFFGHKLISQFFFTGGLSELFRRTQYNITVVRQPHPVSMSIEDRGWPFPVLMRLIHFDTAGSVILPPKEHPFAHFKRPNRPGPSQDTATQSVTGIRSMECLDCSTTHGHGIGNRRIFNFKLRQNTNVFALAIFTHNSARQRWLETKHPLVRREPRFGEQLILRPDALTQQFFKLILILGQMVKTRLGQHNLKQTTVPLGPTVLPR